MNSGVVKASDRRKAFLKLWHQERKMDMIFRQNEQAPRAEGPVDQPWCPADPFDSRVQPGDVRLLDETLVLDATRPVYVAVLNVDKSQGIALVSSFSPYATPATNTEWLTGLAAPALRVLQLWNAQPFPLRAIARSWLAGELPPEKLDRARALYRLCILGDYPAADDREDVGLAVVDLDDARCRYQEEGFLNFSPLHAWMDRHLSLLDSPTESVRDVVRRFAARPKPNLAAAADGLKRCSLLVKGLETPAPLWATRDAVVGDPDGAWQVVWVLGPAGTFQGKVAEGMPVYAFAGDDGAELLHAGIVVESGEECKALFSGYETPSVYEALSAGPTLLVVEGEESPAT